MNAPIITVDHAALAEQYGHTVEELRVQLARFVGLKITDSKSYEEVRKAIAKRVR